MNKRFITKKELQATHKTIISLGNYDFKCPEQPDFYWAGIYGWYCDIYSWGTTAINYGYNTIGKKPNNLEKIMQEYNTIYSQWADGIITLNDYWDYIQFNFIPQLKAGL